MRLSLWLGLLLTTSCTATQRAAATRPLPGAAEFPTDILLLGCDHLAQLYKPDNPLTDVLTPRRQAELAVFNRGLARFRPAAIMVEELPEQQARLDSLYQRYCQGQLELATLPDGRSEVYQVAFVLGKQLGLPRIHCINAPGGTSQSVLHEGTNIALYQQATEQMRARFTPVGDQLRRGELSLGAYLRFINEPATLSTLHTVVYRTAARVTDGTLRPDPMIDAAFISRRHVGAEFVSVFYNRDLKMYSNIVTTQLATRSSRILTITGARHVASLQGIFRTDPAYRVVEAQAFLPRN